MSTKHFFLDQHGCAKNQVDGELIIGILQQKGWIKTDIPEEADLIIINSCGFIEPAKVESINAVITARTAYPDAKILLAGCLSERYGEMFKDELPEADAFFGNGDLNRLPEVIDTLFPQKKDAGRTVHSRIFIQAKQEGVCSGIRPEILNFPGSVFIKITEGCSNACSFCAIPLIRGSVRSRPIVEITAEIQAFIQKGYKEFNLIGQDLAAFTTGTKNTEVSGLAVLLQHIAALEGDFWIRLLYIHPDHFPRDIVPIMAADNRFLPYFDIPFQSGSERIIHAMNRRGNASRYLELGEYIRNAFRSSASAYGNAVLRTTFLTGFPGETSTEAQATEDFLQQLRPLWSGAFVYSPEEGTKAVSLKPRVSAKIAAKRQNRLHELQTEITQNELASFCGQELRVLIEEILPKETEDDEMRLALGRTWFQAPDVDGSVVVNFPENQKDSEGKPLAAGSFVSVRITAVHGIDLEAAALPYQNDRTV